MMVLKMKRRNEMVITAIGLHKPSVGAALFNFFLVRKNNSLLTTELKNTATSNQIRNKELVGFFVSFEGYCSFQQKRFSSNCYGSRI